jgi:hypothetical protein
VTSNIERRLVDDEFGVVVDTLCRGGTAVAVAIRGTSERRFRPGFAAG